MRGDDQRFMISFSPVEDPLPIVLECSHILFSYSVDLSLSCPSLMINDDVIIGITFIIIKNKKFILTPYNTNIIN